MADTLSGGDHGNCEDCGCEHAWMAHNGPLVPVSRWVTLCGPCFQKRSDWYHEHGEPLPIPASDIYKTNAVPAEEVPMDDGRSRKRERVYFVKKFA